VAELREPALVVAVAALAVALVSLITTALLAMRLKRVRTAQLVVLGETTREDLVAHAAGLDRAFHELRDRVEGVGERLDTRMSAVEGRLDGAVAHRALVRYDAYGELAGKQSMSLALLDSHRNGVVISSIAHRDTARMYCKPVFDGAGEQPLSPEEQEAIRLALDGRTQSVTLES
jgi:hypothetical protein